LERGVAGNCPRPIVAHRDGVWPVEAIIKCTAHRQTFDRSVQTAASINARSISAVTSQTVNETEIPSRAFQEAPAIGRGDGDGGQVGFFRFSSWADGTTNRPGVYIIAAERVVIGVCDTRREADGIRSLIRRQNSRVLLGFETVAV